MAVILVVEDEAQILILATSYLEEQGHMTLTAGTLEQALALIDRTTRLTSCSQTSALWTSHRRVSNWLTRGASTSLGPWRGSPARRRVRPRADQTARTAAPATRCNDVAWIGQLRRLTRFDNFGTSTPGSFMGKREPSTILKTDERSIHLELGRGGQFNRQINWLG
jgi:CheY-like chemotaxis protein